MAGRSARLDYYPRAGKAVRERDLTIIRGEIAKGNLRWAENAGNALGRSRSSVMEIRRKYLPELDVPVWELGKARQEGPRKEPTGEAPSREHVIEANTDTAGQYPNGHAATGDDEVEALLRGIVEAITGQLASIHATERAVLSVLMDIRDSWR